MSRVLTILLLLVCTSRGSTQEIVTLRAVPLQEPYTWRVDTVVDHRQDQSLGKVPGYLGEEVSLALYSGASEAVTAFYRGIMTTDSTARPIQVTIKAMHVQVSRRRMNDGIAEVARAHVHLSFAIKVDSSWVVVYDIKHNEDDVYEVGDVQGPYRTHERRLRAALEYCLLRYVDSIEQGQDSNTRLVTDSPPSITVVNPTLPAHLAQWINMITIKGMRSRYFEGYALSYTGFADSERGLIRPYEASLEVTWARRDIATESGYSDINAFVLRPELYFFYKRLFPGVYASLSANVPVGFELWEDLEGDRGINPVVGAGASQGLRLIPWQDRGIVLGIDFFQQVETSKLYRFDLGMEVAVGINF